MPVGTDFLTFATGGGANIEDQLSYLNDAQRQTGGLPGIARSNFHNKATRQGSFVACAISTFVTQTIAVYVPDDGDVQKYVDYFKQALTALFIGLLPDDPDLSIYLPKAGGTMTGDIQFIPGASIQLANNTWLRGKNTAGVPQGMLLRGTDNNIYISDGSSAYTIFGNTPVVANARYYSAQDTVGGVHPILGILGDNNTYFQAYNSLFINSSNVWLNSSIIIPNSTWYYAKNAAGGAAHLLGINNVNDTYVGAGAPRDTYIYAANTRTVYIQNALSIAGAVLMPVLTVTGATDLQGGTTLRAIGVYGASNFYARLNVNNSVGATITGDIATNSITVYGGGITTDGPVNSLGGTTYLTYARAYWPGQNDPFQILADAGHYARIGYTVANVRLWTAGCAADGAFNIADESGALYAITIAPGSTTVTIRNNVIIGTSLQVNNNVLIYGPVSMQSNLGVAGTGFFGGRTNVGDLWSRGNVFISDDEYFYLGNSPTLKWLNFHPYRYLYWGRTDGHLYYSSDNYVQMQIEFYSSWLIKNWQGPMAAKGFLVQGLYRNELHMQMDTVRDVERRDALDIIMNLHPVLYRQPRQERRRNNGTEPYFLDEEPEEIGFVTEEVRAVLPQAVVDVAPRPTVFPYTNRNAPKHNPDYDPPNALNPHAILAVAVKAIQEMNERLARLEAAAA